MDENGNQGHLIPDDMLLAMAQGAQAVHSGGSHYIAVNNVPPARPLDGPEAKNRKHGPRMGG